ncbi:MAG: DegV family protein [Anaerolineales bacterium]|nr:DegV family protein [Anaerolineales bacterium]
MKQSKIAIVTDSTAHIPAHLVAQYNIHVIPLTLNWEGQSLLDIVDITPQAFYERLKTAREMPTTSQPSVQQFHDLFAKIAGEAEAIVGVFLSEELSGTLASARSAAQEMKGLPIEIVDSRSSSMGLGFMALAAARAAERGLSHIEVAQAARALVERMRVILVVDTLEFLYRGGRISGTQRLAGSMLSIKPVLHITYGRIEPLASVRTKRKAILTMLDIAEKETRGQSEIHAAVIDAALSDETQFIDQQVRTRLNPVELVQTELSPVIGAHVGPGTVGVIYYAQP